jgi:hypothetical protein
LVGDLSGTKIYIHPFDHAPPHVHVYRAEYEAMVNMRSLQIMEGAIPRKAYRPLMEWMDRNSNELLERWNLAQEGEPIEPITEG